MTNLSKWPYFASDEIEAVSKVLRSGKINYWTGEECKLFEKEFADFIGVKHAISLANGTVALELALRALGIGQGDDVIVPCRILLRQQAVSLHVVQGPLSQMLIWYRKISLQQVLLRY